MSVPGRIGVILIVILGLIDGIVLVGGARQAASTIETGALAQKVEPVKALVSEHSIAGLVHDIEWLAAKFAPDAPSGI